MRDFEYLNYPSPHQKKISRRIEQPEVSLTSLSVKCALENGTVVKNKK